MNTQLSTKFAAVLIALMMNALILGGVASVFDAVAGNRASDASMADQPVTTAASTKDVV